MPIIIENLGFDAVLVGGTTGEWIQLTLDERKKLIKEWSKCVKNTKLKILAHVSDVCIKNVHALVDVAKECNVWSILILPQQILQIDNIKKYLIDATKGYKFMYYHYPELYGYSHVNIDELQNSISNMIGSKIVSKTKKSNKYIFVEEFIIKYINYKILFNKLNELIKENEKNKSRFIIEKLYNIDLGKSRYNLNLIKNADEVLSLLC